MLGKTVDSIQIEGACHRLHQAVGFLSLDIRCYLTGTLIVCQHLGKVCLVSLKALGSLETFFIYCELRIAKCLCLQLLTTQGFSQLDGEGVHRVTVHHEMVEVSQEVDLILNRDDDHTIKRTTRQTERLQELLLIRLEF